MPPAHALRRPSSCPCPRHLEPTAVVLTGALSHPLARKRKGRDPLSSRLVFGEASQSAPSPQPTAPHPLALATTPAPEDTVPASPPMYPSTLQFTWQPECPLSARQACWLPTTLSMKTGPSAGHSKLPPRPESHLSLKLISLPSTNSELWDPSLLTAVNLPTSEPLRMLFPQPEMPFLPHSLLC